VAQVQASSRSPSYATLSEVGLLDRAVGLDDRPPAWDRPTISGLRRPAQEKLRDLLEQPDSSTWHGVPVVEDCDQPVRVRCSPGSGTYPGNGWAHGPCGSRKSILGGSKMTSAS
jgi:hypothetical protein